MSYLNGWMIPSKRKQILADAIRTNPNVHSLWRTKSTKMWHRARAVKKLLVKVWKLHETLGVVVWKDLQVVAVRLVGGDLENSVELWVA